MQKRLAEISMHLLDLGKRNRLLNYRDKGLKTITCLNKNFDIIFSKITSSTTLNIFNLDPVLAKYNKTIDDTNQTVLQYKSGKVKDVVEGLLKPNDILCYKEGIALNKVLKSLYKDYRESILEKGVNSLYMTFGLVEYKDKDEVYSAPLLLVPITLDLEMNNYKIKECDDDVIVNPTLRYLLRTEYKFNLEEYFDKEDTITSYFIRQSAILEKHNMHLVNHISIGIYSFLKMNMFEDLNNNMEIVLKNKNILRLLDEKVLFQQTNQMPIYPVVDADSSQIEAIKSACSNESFVLQGPPGSGKSQTITNIIASLIANGKKVLFVSEKQAALNVVYENLKRANLDSFALELHSHKANKKEFIDELYKTACLPKYSIKDDAKNVKDKYNYLISKLDDYRQIIHKPIERLNLSLYDIYSRYLSLPKIQMNYQINNVESYDYLYLDNCQKILNQYALVSEKLSYDYHEGPFYGFICSDLNYIRYNAINDLILLKNFFEDKVNVKNKIVNHLPIKINSYLDLLKNIDYLEKIVDLNYFMPEYFIKTKRNALLNLLEDYLKSLKYLENSTLKNFIDLNIVKINISEKLNLLRTCSQKTFKFLSFKYHKLKKELKSFMKIKMKDADLIYKLEEAIEYKNYLIKYNKAKKQLPQEYRPYEYEIIYKDLIKLEKLDFDLELSNSEYQNLKIEFVDILMYFNQNNNLNLKKYLDKFDSNIIDLINGNLDSNQIRFEQMSKATDLLDLHAQRLEILKKIEGYNLLDFLNKALENKISLDKLSIEYEVIFWQENIYHLIDNNLILKEFSGLGIDNLIEEFKVLDLKNLETNKAYIISKLSNLRPDDSIMAGSKFSILVKEYNKVRKQKPIRVLLEEILDLVMDIKPVFLMSPLSVSTYLNSKNDLFDVVIFDEASQVFAWDALGAIYRSKECIIIGDSKQMPPSNFFNSNLSDDEDSDYENDLESILDKASALFTTRRLNFHYRSRSEELIAFSNQEFYDNKLITIPQAKAHKEGFGIDFYYLNDGIYEPKTRINVKEANYICELVFKHFATTPERSLGVVAFSNAQAEYIMNVIEDKLEQYPEYKKYFNEDLDEPFFVKNLESVQGDERDRIIFSICFGYNQDKKFYQRFGPLNNIGGERRLNVAITRAKYNICVVSSIKAKDIKLENTDSIGVKLLKGYLDYAENIKEPKHSHDNLNDGVVNDIQMYLKSLGFLVQKYVGTSSFKIDLAVMHPVTKEYVVAIMLDGPSYIIGNCSDANRLQEMLLNRLGWKYYRIFSTLWITQEKLEKDKLANYLNQVFNDNLPKTSNHLIEDSYLDVTEDNFDDSFVKYDMVSLEEIKKLYNTKTIPQIIKYIVKKEEPIHVDYLLKRICFMYGRTKVTNIVRELFNEDLEKLDLINEKNFFMISKIENMSLRIDSDRTIEQIHISELQDAIYKIVKKSNGITKDGCFKHVVKLLGYNRMSENAINYLDEALVFLKLDGKIVEKDGSLYV